MVRKSQGITDRHMKILNFLKSFQDEYGYPPTIRQIGEHIGVQSTSQVTYYLNQLEARNLIERDQHTSRSIRVLENLAEKVRQVADEIWSIPVFGRIVASEPIPMPPNNARYYDDYSSVELARSLFGAREKQDDLFALEVEGDSMIDAMINNGDIVIMRQANDAQNGEMVAVWLDDENSTTLKYFYKEGSRVRLQPANPTMKPIYIDDPKDLRIMGKVVMVVRQIQKEPQKAKQL
jgi:repressor LexA